MYQYSKISDRLERELPVPGGGRSEEYKCGKFTTLLEEFMKRYLNMPDTRPVDDWGNPIGQPYEKKRWEDLTPDEQMADFEWKSDILASMGEEMTCSTFYQDYLFQDLYEGNIPADYKVVLTEYDAESGNKMKKVSVVEINDYLHLDDVALSPCLFYGNWRRKKLLNYVCAFVLDVDKVRPMHLKRFFSLFEADRLLTPTFIANSGSGIHFYYVLDHALKCDSGYNEANNLIAEEIYNRLYDDVSKKEKWKDAQRHWVGQDYRVVNSKTRLHQTSQIFKVGEVYTIDELIKHYGVKVDRTKKYASKAMIKYAGNIAKDLGIDPPDYTDYKETYNFIYEHKDAAYLVREQKREERKAKNEKRKRKSTGKPVTWYKNTLYYMQDHTMPGHRFSSMKALAIIAFKEKVPQDVFLRDIDELAKYWEAYDWNGDDFNVRNVAAILRLYDNAVKYSNTSAETLEEWLGYEFKRIGVKRNGRNQKIHLARARAVQKLDYPEGEWRNKEGRPKAVFQILDWRAAHPDGRKADCIRDTGLSKPTVYKWWDAK